MTLGRDRDYFARNETIRNYCCQTGGKRESIGSTDAGKVSGSGAIDPPTGTSTAVSRISRRAVIGSLERSGHRHDPGQPNGRGEHLEPSAELVRERTIDNERPSGPDACVDLDIPAWLKHDPNSVAPSAIPRAPINPAPSKPTVLSISQIMAAEARAKNSRPCPPGLCEHCYRHACRLLLKTCCICTGGISLSKKNFFPAILLPDGAGAGKPPKDFIEVASTDKRGNAG